MVIMHFLADSIYERLSYLSVNIVVIGGLVCYLIYTNRTLIQSNRDIYEKVKDINMSRAASMYMSGEFPALKEKLMENAKLRPMIYNTGLLFGENILMAIAMLFFICW